MIINLSHQHSLLSQWMHEIRAVDIQQDRMRFRRNTERVGEIIAYEISKTLEYTHTETTTPLGNKQVETIVEQPILATILRAGIPLHQGLLNYFDQSDCAFIAAYRKHNKADGTFEIEQHYVTCPDLDGKTLIIADPMLATGASLILAIEGLLEFGKPKSIHIATVISCSEGIDNVLRKFPEAHIWAGDIDDELTAKGYIVPGLGDAGDLSFGSKLQF
ncbi:uracil phosphoribosyltransferase [Taibaiella sp. KBW10]|uniref:uracil phosphoribosyltransferase n=1 Tax=Taibaiella sp. KBW10 TaxID=2153357 RepID=UPI000F5AFD05|nr:uracil phosphoribosyltransferase [Taibaiella sp. KBW10]RQO31329.1 uracil phosphoribosyltransferase [Taibaiella sp. KBW10]